MAILSVAVTSLLMLLPALPVPTANTGTIPTPAAVSRDMCTLPSGWKTPFTHAYRFRNGATVVFVGVEHSDDPTDATHRQVRAAFDRYKPEVTLIEGTSSAKSASDWFRKDLADLAKQRTDAGAVGENLYAVRLASDAGTAFYGWDFSPDQDYRTLVADGFAIKDALGAHLLRSHIDPFGGDPAGALERQMRYVAMVEPLAGFDYTAWYRRIYRGRFDPANGTPCGSGIGSAIVSDLSYRRNLNMTHQIETYAVPGRTVLVEAGANHWLALRDWLASRSARVD